MKQILISILISVNLFYSIPSSGQSVEERAKFWVTKGNKKMNSENYKGAIKDFNFAIALDPNNADALLARDTAKKVLAKVPNERSAEGERNGNSGYSIPSSGQSVEERAKFWVTKGNKKMNSENYKGAIKDFNFAIALDPNNADALLARDAVKKVLGETSNERSAEGEIKVSSGYSIPATAEAAVESAKWWVAEGNKKIRSGDYKRAIQDFNFAITIDPNNADALLARDAVKKVLGETSNERSAEGEIKVNSANYMGAIQDWNKAIELDPSNDTYYKLRGGNKYKLEDYRGAIQDWNKAIELDPSNDTYYALRGGAKYILEDYRGVIQDLNKAIELNPSNEAYYRVRGIAKMIIGNKNEGCLDLSKAGELGSKEAYETIREFCN
jgi:tetratricopeptide (TPR) repeat protein